MGREQSLRLEIVVSSGSGTGTVTNAWDKISKLRICPPAETVSYTAAIKDAGGYYVFPPFEWTGTLPISDLSLGIIKQILITSASQDGTWTVKLDMH